MPASIFSETELARLASFPEEIPGDDLIRAFTLTGADRDLVAIRRGAANRWSKMLTKVAWMESPPVRTQRMRTAPDTHGTRTNPTLAITSACSKAALRVAHTVDDPERDENREGEDASDDNGVVRGVRRSGSRAAAARAGVGLISVMRMATELGTHIAKGQNACLEYFP